MTRVLLALIGAAALVFACDGKFEFEDEGTMGAAGDNHGPPDEEDCPECGECPECTALGLVCDRDGFPCVECVSEDQCSNNRPRCHKELRRCVACIGNDNCRHIPGSTCDQFTHECVAGCATESNPLLSCGDEFYYCDSERSVCAICGSDHDCESSDTGPLCMETSCVECRRKDDCFDGKVCDPVLFKCVECAEWDDCDHDEVCDLRSHECVKSLEPAGHLR